LAEILPGVVKECVDEIVDLTLVLEVVVGAGKLHRVKNSGDGWWRSN
jgi:hypothetical protein